ncbi:copper amine oxidase N-terminal domain-containing protein [Paenibacillus shenyangensis]|uniref:copper amine oxidase N-terminal domain-containing protein n=1 Tax=Paenibacillus sp. A9 TaxID=1284352 RepID=UPI0003647FB1|nr:copper amine oxidase N-terminal domain-containing protein [Paenibacillus sp. A9]
MKMRKLIAPVLGLSLLLPAAGAFAAEGTTADYNPELKTRAIQFNMGSKLYMVNGKSMSMSIMPVEYMGTTYVPLRYLANNANMKVSYDKATSTTWLDTGIQRYEFWVNSKVYKVDNMRKGMNDMVISRNGHVLVPVRWFADNFEWDLMYDKGMITLTKTY